MVSVHWLLLKTLELSLLALVISQNVFLGTEMRTIMSLQGSKRDPKLVLLR